MIKRADVNIWKYFGNQLEDMRFKGYPIFELSVKPLESLNISSGHNDKNLMIVDILNKCLIGLDDFEILIEGYFGKMVLFLIINDDRSPAALILHLGLHYYPPRSILPLIGIRAKSVYLVSV